MANPLVSYGLIVALQFRMVWNIWRSKDLETADGSQYFFFATSWTHGFHHDIVWSPLYTDYWGTVLAVVGDVYNAAIAQRVLIILVAAVLVLALMRAFVGPTVGLLIAAWWAILPTNYNVLFEVHLFALLPILVTALILARSGGRRTLGAALGILALSALLIRNELVVATAVLGAAVLVHELRERRVKPAPLSAYVRAYGVPLLVVCLVAAGAYWRSFDQGNNIRTELRDKTSRNLCQVYAFYYKQRFPARFPGNPFSDCLPLMQSTFGRQLPTLLEATEANPRAIAAFAAWNTRLLASGLQVSLLGATSTGDDPDFIPVKTHRDYALILSVLVLALIGAGLMVIKRQWAFWRGWLEPRRWSAAALGATAITAVVVAWTERPRPEYMFGLAVGLLALIGLCTSALLKRFRLARHAAVLALVLPVLLGVSLPVHYHPGPRPLRDAVERLQIVRPQLRQPGSVLIASSYNAEICGYLAESVFKFCTSPPWGALVPLVTRKHSLCQVLADARATVIYADPILESDPTMAKLLASPAANGWRRVAAGTGADGPWSVLVPVHTGQAAAAACPGA